MTKIPSRRIFDLVLNRFSAAATILGIGIAIYFGIKSEHHKELTLEYLGQIELLALSSDDSNTFSVIHNDTSEVIPKPTLLEVKITNTGRATINGLPFTKDGDVEIPITIHLPTDLVIAQTIASRSPQDITANSSLTKDGVTVTHGILNKEDTIFLKIWLRRPLEQWPKASCRIDGIQNITLRNPADIPRRGIFQIINDLFMLAVMGSMAALSAAGVFLAIFEFTRSMFKPTRSVIRSTVSDAASKFPQLSPFLLSPPLGPEDAAFEGLFTSAIDNIEVLTNEDLLLRHSQSYYPEGVVVDDALAKSLVLRIQTYAKQVLIDDLLRSLKHNLGNKPASQAADQLNLDFDIKILTRHSLLVDTLCNQIQVQLKGYQPSVIERANFKMLQAGFILLTFTVVFGFFAWETWRATR